jgi:hypothetical protein
MSLRKSLIKSFRREYSSRLENALAVEEWSRVEPNQRHIAILRKLSESDVTSLTVDGDTYGASEPVLVLLEFTFQLIEIAESIFPLSYDLVVKLFPIVQSFADGSSEELLRPGRGVTPATLALSAAGIHFYSRLVEFIRCRFVRAGALACRVEHYFSQMTILLTESYRVVVKSIEKVFARVITAEWRKEGIHPGTEPMEAVRIMEKVFFRDRGILECLPQFLRRLVFKQIRTTQFINHAMTSLDSVKFLLDISLNIPDDFHMCCDEIDAPDVEICPF